MGYTQQSGPPPARAESRPAESSPRINASVQPVVAVWGVVEVDLGVYADNLGWITDVPASSLPCPPAGSLVRLIIGDAHHLSPLILCQLADLIPPGCRVEVCGSRGNAVADVVTALRAALARSHALGDIA